MKYMLKAWIAERGRKHWAEGVSVVQWQKNNTLNRTIKRSPFQAIFGRSPATKLRRYEPVSDLNDPDNGKEFKNFIFYLLKIMFHALKTSKNVAI